MANNKRNSKHHATAAAAASVARATQWGWGYGARGQAAPHVGDASTCNACLPVKQDAFFKYFPVAASTVSALITGSTRRASPCPGRVATCATCGATTLPRPHQLVAAIYGYERASSATLVATIYAANSVAGLLLHAARCEGAKLPRCKVHEAVAMPHIWPKQDSSQIAPAVTSCHGTCNTHRLVCATHICNSPRIRFHWPLSRLCH